MSCTCCPATALVFIDICRQVAGLLADPASMPHLKYGQLRSIGYLPPAPQACIYTCWLPADGSPVHTAWFSII